MNNFFSEEDLVSAYTRQQAVEDGVLVDVTETAQKANIRFPVALTRAVFEDCVAWSKKDAKESRHLQDESGRLWDVVWLLYLAMRSAKNQQSEVVFQLHRIPRPGSESKKKQVQLRAQVHPGDHAEPVVTVMLLHED